MTCSGPTTDLLQAVDTALCYTNAQSYVFKLDCHYTGQVPSCLVLTALMSITLGGRILANWNARMVLALACAAQLQLTLACQVRSLCTTLALFS